MEDSNKLHEETLKIAKSLIERDPALKDWVTEKFPELKESEDERIRKEIIQSIQDNMCVIHKDECIAWLEKQGEQKPDFCHHEVDLSNCSEYYRKAYYDGWNNCNQQHAQLEAEQKPTWSEEDEGRFQSCLNILQEKGFMGVGVIETINSKWLKSLKDSMKGEKPNNHATIGLKTLKNFKSWNFL